jgi:hypothetical protein
MGQRWLEDAGAAAWPAAAVLMGRSHVVRPRSPASSITASLAGISRSRLPRQDAGAAAQLVPAFDDQLQDPRKAPAVAPSASPLWPT